jgi:recombination protein RecT
MAKTTQLQVIAQYLNDKVDRIGELLPRNAPIDKRTLVRVALMAVNENPALLACSPQSIYAAVLESARLGLEIGGPVAQAYLVPYKMRDKVTKQLVTRASFQPSYRGLIDLVMRNGGVRKVNVQAVYVGDLFKRDLGILGTFIHEPGDDPDRESREITHVYSEFLFPDKEVTRFVMTTKEINEHARRFSKSWGDPDGPWKTDWKSMASKTVIRLPIMRGLVPVHLRDDVRQYVVAEDTQPGSLKDLAGTFGAPEIPCDAEGEITEEEKAQILAQEAAGE